MLEENSKKRNIKKTFDTILFGELEEEEEEETHQKEWKLQFIV